jgi:hypothetical protein
MRDLVSKVDEILLHEWDPIGVRNHPEAWDEYSSYAPGLLRFAMRGNIDVVADQLYKLKHEHMGLSYENRALDRTIAQRLVDLASQLDH